MNIKDFDNYREHLSKAGIEPGLDRMRLLCERLGDPQKKLKFIHVAGTNGKGSVCAFISSILMESGIKTGRFTSPAVESEKERYWINGRTATITALCRNMEEVKAAADQMVFEGEEEPTLFEVECALAFLLFFEAGCEIVVLECGMGGAGDATNVIDTPLVSVFSSISLDHTKYLGKTIEAIAKEKSGIIKQGGHTVSVSQSSEAASVIKAAATLKKNDLTIADVKNIKNIKFGVRGTTFDYGRMRGLKIRLAGTYQPENASVAIAAIDSLKKSRLRITEDQIRKGLLSAVWPGRFEVIGSKPMFIIDGAHNEDAAKRLAESVNIYLKDQIQAGKLIYIFGVLGDKNYPAIAGTLAPYASHIITVSPPGNPRALPALALAETVKKYNETVSAAGSLEEALEMAYLLSDKDSVILAFGSLSFLGELKKITESKANFFAKKQMKV